MEELAKSRWLAYGSLATALAGGIAIIITALADYQMASDPRARPNSFTPADFIAGIAPIKQQVAILNEQLLECRRDANDDVHGIRLILAELKDEDKEFNNWRRSHSRETDRWRGGIDADHREFHRLLRMQ